MPDVGSAPVIGVPRLVVVSIAVAMAVVTASAAIAPPAPIKFATRAPTGSIWHKALGDLGSAWRKATDGRVAMVVFPDGSLGEESATVEKMRSGTIHAALLTANGLASIDRSFNVFTIPFFFENEEEELAVQRALTPTLEATLADRGFHLLCWSAGGWIQLFSKKPLKTLADVKASNLAVNKADTDLIQWYGRSGFHPHGLGGAEVASQLKLAAGAVDAAPSTPYIALSTQMFRSAGYMFDVRVAPLVGAAIMTTNTWLGISATDRARLTEAAAVMEQAIRTKAPAQDAESIKAMTARGLHVYTPDAKSAAEFRTAAGELGVTMRGTVVPAETYDAARRVIEEIRGRRKRL